MPDLTASVAGKLVHPRPAHGVGVFVGATAQAHSTTSIGLGVLVLLSAGLGLAADLALPFTLIPAKGNALMITNPAHPLLFPY